MDSVEFATKYCGKRFKLPLELFADVADQLNGYHPSGLLVGYVNGDSERVVLELDEYNQCGWPLHPGVTLTLNREDFYSSEPSVVAVNYKRLPPYRSLGDIRREWDAKKVVEPITAYPNNCKKCNAPARNYGNRTMCSNNACRTRGAVLKSLDIKYRKTRLVRCTFKYHNDKICNKAAVCCRLASKYTIGDNYLIDCEAGHKFNLAAKDLKENDLIAYTLIGNDNSDRIWNGQQWQTY